jgi:hypothetical protein
MKETWSLSFIGNLYWFTCDLLKKNKQLPFLFPCMRLLTVELSIGRDVWGHTTGAGFWPVRKQRMSAELPPSASEFSEYSPVPSLYPHISTNINAPQWPCMWSKAFMRWFKYWNPLNDQDAFGESMVGLGSTPNALLISWVTLSDVT